MALLFKILIKILFHVILQPPAKKQSGKFKLGRTSKNSKKHQEAPKTTQNKDTSLTSAENFGQNCEYIAHYRMYVMGCKKTILQDTKTL